MQWLDVLGHALTANRLRAFVLGLLATPAGLAALEWALGPQLVLRLCAS